MPASVDSSPARRRATSATTTSTGAPLVSRSPARPASPSRWRSRTMRAGGQRRGVGPPPRRIGRQLGRDAVPQLPSRPTSRTTPGAGRAERAQHHARLHRPVPAVALEVDDRVLRPGARGGQRPLGAAEGHPAGAGAAADQREPGVPALLAHGGDVLDARRGHEQARLRVRRAERSQARELLRRVQGQRPAGHHGVDALGRASGRRAPATAPAWAARAARRASTRPPRSPARQPSGGRRSRSGAWPRRPARRAGRTRGCCGPTRGRGRHPGR